MFTESAVRSEPPGKRCGKKSREIGFPLIQAVGQSPVCRLQSGLERSQMCVEIEFFSAFQSEPFRSGAETVEALAHGRFIRFRFQEKDSFVSTPCKRLRRQLPNPEVIDADVVYHRVPQMLKQHDYRTRRFQQSFNQILADYLGGRNENHGIGFRHNAGKVEFAEIAETMLNESPVPFQSCSINAFFHRIQIEGWMVRAQNADTCGNVFEPLCDPVSFPPKRTDDNPFGCKRGKSSHGSSVGNTETNRQFADNGQDFSRGKCIDPLP